MNKIKSTLFVAVFAAITATTTLADGHIPIGGRCITESRETTAAMTIIVNEPTNEIPLEISDYLWTFADIFGQFKF
jgi:hypothetical protein